MSVVATVSSGALAEIDKAVAKYPPDRKQSAVMAALTIVQGEKGPRASNVVKG